MTKIEAILNSKILIVDDSMVNIKLLTRILMNAGYSFINATSKPEEVCAMHMKTTYDLILLDIQMPFMDGFEVMKGLQSLAADRPLPVLVVSAQPTHELLSMSAGAIGFISKPFKLSDFVGRIETILNLTFVGRKLRIQ